MHLTKEEKSRYYYFKINGTITIIKQQLYKSHKNKKIFVDEILFENELKKTFVHQNAFPEIPLLSRFDDFFH